VDTHRKTKLIDIFSEILLRKKMLFMKDWIIDVCTSFDPTNCLIENLEEPPGCVAYPKFF